jgi:NitT/TauT family transport system substrate-binding protein
MPDADSLPFMVARDEGFFSREGVNVELISFSNFQERDAALQAGRIDGAISDLLAAVFFAAGGFDVRAVSLTDGRYGIIGSPQSANSSLAGLRGQKIAISSNTIIHYTAIAQMEAAGIPEDTYELIAVPRMPLRLEMLLSGQVAAACLPEPFLTAAAGQGAVPLSTTDTLGIDAGVIVFSKKVLDERLDDAILFFRAVYNASLKINANPQSYREYLVEQAAFPAEVKDTYRFVTYRKPTLPDTRQIEQVIRWLKSRDLLEADVQAGDLIDPRIAAAASAW